MSAAANRPTSVFISYSRADSSAIDRLEAELISYGFTTWVDRTHIEGGDRWAAQIERAIEASDIVVVGLSPASVASFWVINELFFAHQRKKPIIPILLRPVEHVPLLLAAIQYIDMLADEPQGLQQLRLRLLQFDRQSSAAVVAPLNLTDNSPVAQRIAPTPEQHISDPAAQLVTLPMLAPTIDLHSLFVQGMKAKVRRDLDQAEALLQQVVELDAQFGDGLAAAQLAEIQRELLPSQLERLSRQAHQAEEQGTWGEAVGAWQAFLDRVPDDVTAQSALRRDEQNQAAAWLYEDARALAQEQDWLTFHQIWQLLRERAPDYGDPDSIHPDNRERDTTLPQNAERESTQPAITLPDSTHSEEVKLDGVDAIVPQPENVHPGRHIAILLGTLLITCTGHIDTVESVAWSSNGLQLATVGDDNTARVWNADTGESLVVFSDHGSRYVKCVDWEPDGSRIATAGWDEFVRIWDANSGAQVVSYRHDTHLLADFRLGFLESVAWSPRGSRLAAAGWDDAVRVWDITSGEQVVICKGHSAAVNSVVWSPDGTRLATASADNTARVWDAQTGEQMSMLRHASRVMSVTWVPDNQRLATGSFDAALQVWQVKTGELLLSSRNSYNPIFSVSWSPDGLRLATAGWDQAVRIWNAVSGELLLLCQGHTSHVQCVAWAPDSQRIATASDDKTVCVWRV